MRIIKREPLRLFASRWPMARNSLDDWYRRTLKAEWSNFSEVKSTFGQTDQVRVKSGNTVLVFDIGGNQFRLITGVSYRKGKIYVLRVMTPKEYDRDALKEQL